jgi:hypothetical protein
MGCPDAIPAYQAGINKGLRELHQHMYTPSHHILLPRAPYRHGADACKRQHSPPWRCVQLHHAMLARCPHFQLKHVQVGPWPCLLSASVRSATRGYNQRTTFGKKRSVCASTAGGSRRSARFLLTCTVHWRERAEPRRGHPSYRVWGYRRTALLLPEPSP